MDNNKRSTVRNRNPFAVEPLPKAFYHPSPEKHLNRAEKSISIKPGSSSEEIEGISEENKRVSPEDEMFLRGTNMYQTKPSRPNDTEDDVNFDESWPASERPSSISLNGYEDDSAEQLHEYLSRIDNLIGTKQYSDSKQEDVSSLERKRMPGSSAQGSGVTASRETGKPYKSKIPVKDTGQGGRKFKSKEAEPGDEAEADGSVLQRYINRFRNSAPMSREEREQSQSSSQDFWWLSNGAPPAKKRERKAERDSNTVPLTTVNLDKYKQLQKLAEKQFPAHVPESPGDKRTIALQERAEKLLERSSSTVLSTDPAVSTEGLGSNSSDMSSLEEYTYRPKFAGYLDQRTGYQQNTEPPLLGQRPQTDFDHRAGNQQFVPHQMPGQRPPTENDPLYQWRLRRRMELAQESAPQSSPQFDFINKSEQQKNMDMKLEEFKQRLSGRAPTRSQMQFTPAPVQQQAQIPPPQQTGSGRYHEPQIASPSLHPPKPKSEPVEEIDPHLHLMCDLLPCPHRGTLQGTSNNVNIEQRYASSGQGTVSEVKSNLNDNVQTNDHKKSNQTEYFDKMGKYKQYLEAEKPDIEQTNSETDTCDVDRGKNEKSERKGPKSIQEIENMVKEIGVEDKDGVNSRKSHREEANFDKKSDKSRKDENYGESSGSESERSKTRSKRLEKVPNEADENQRESEDRRGKVLKPTHSSSPKNGRKGVSAVIGQAVKEHLFSTSTSTVLSSVDSLPPSASTERLPWKQKPRSHDRSHDQLVRQIEQDDVPYESDEEFSDDNLLQMLRKQRAMYEQQLQEIDDVLNKTESS